MTARRSGVFFCFGVYNFSGWGTLCSVPLLIFSKEK
jgi:hypothetical protein